jgi:hypothetical protein
MINNKLDERLIPSNVPEEAVQDFRNYGYYVMKYMGFGEPTPIQYGIMDALQNHDNDMVLAAGRGTGKSVITSMLASWWLLRDPNVTILVTSATAQKAIDFISMTRNILTAVPFMNHLLPGEDDTDNAMAFNTASRIKVSQDKSVSAAGITSQIIGRHADYIVGDDLEVRGNCDTQEMRDKLLGRIHEFESIRNKGGRVIFLGTPHTRDSNYNKLAAAGYPFIKFPAEFPDPTIPTRIEHISSWIMDRMIELEASPGDPTQPERFDRQTLDERLSKIGPANYALQFLLDTSLSDEEKYPLKLRDIICTDVGLESFHQKVQHARSNPYKTINSVGMSGDKVYYPMYKSEGFEDYIITTIHVDPSGRGHDETGVVVASATPTGYICIHEMLGLDGGYDETVLTKLAELSLQYKAKLIRYEENFGDGMFGTILHPVIAKYCSHVGIDGFRVHGHKEQRILDTIEPVIANGRLVMDPRVLSDKENQIQLTRISRRRGSLKRDDRIDALAHAVSYYTDMLGVDVDKMIVAQEEKNRQEEYDMWENDGRRANMISRGLSGAVKVFNTNKKLPNRLIQWNDIRTKPSKREW